MPASPLAPFSPAVAAWFRSALGEPTRAQALGWPPIARGESTLLLAPTGSGKTLAAFLVAIDRLLRSAADGRAKKRTRVVYVSPVKALAVDVERNLRGPLAAVAASAEQAGAPLAVPSIDVRTGDTSPRDRARMQRSPADILITTPESLYLLLTSAKARAALSGVETIIVDEIHALIATKRGAHLAVSLERLEALREGASAIQRIGLSATQRPLEEAARLLGGFERGVSRPVTIVDAGARKTLELVVEAAAPEISPEERATDPARGDRAASVRSVWPAIHARVVELVRAHTTTIVFVNSRRLAERLAAALNDLHGQQIALAHHGSLAREKRTAIEAQLKRGDLRAIVATSSLELGIDMGTVDLVVQIESPPSVASGLQRIGRACHGVSGVPRGVLLPKHRQDLVACAAGAASMCAGEVEETFYPRNPLDVLAQQIVAMASIEVIAVDALFERVRGAAPYADLPRPAFEGVLDMLSGRYPSDEFAELRPRITWDRVRGVVEGRAGSHRLAVTNGGTIPDRGLYAVFTAGAEGRSTVDPGAPGRRVGELDEEMVFELRPGEVFFLGASSWRAEAITHDRVIVTPAGGEPGKMPFWHGDRAGRSRGFGERIGRLVRSIAEGGVGPADLRKDYALDDAAAASLVAYIREQTAATTEVPSDRAIVIERFVDEVGDWRVVVLCPLGIRVLAPWSIAVASRLRETYVDVDVHYTDDGMAFRIPACDPPPPPESFLPSAEHVEATVTRSLDGTALFAARFRECAGRALLLPRRDPRTRTPLWAQRKRAADLLAVAARHPTFPVVLETYRECLRDAFDLPGLVRLLEDVAARRVRVAVADTRRPSPFAASVLFSFVANFIYEGDAPLAERRAQALAVDLERLRELVGDRALRDLLDPDVIAEHERALQRLSRPVRGADGVHDMLLAIGDLSLDEIRARGAPCEETATDDATADGPDGWVDALVAAGRLVPVRVSAAERFIAVEDAAKFRDGLGVRLPDGIPAALLDAAPRAARDLVARFARTHGPFATSVLAARLGLEEGAAEAEAQALAEEGRLVRGAFLPGEAGVQWCDREVLEAVRRKSLAKVRRAIEPVDEVALARFLPEWHGLAHKRRGREGLLAVIAELEGCPLAASTLEAEILPSRLDPYRAWDLDALCASGEIVWAGLEPLGANDGRIALYRSEREPLLARTATPRPGPIADAIRSALARRGASFFGELLREVGGFPTEVLDTLWQLVWSGEVTNDTLEPLRSRARALGGDAARRLRPNHPPSPRTGAPGSEGRWSLRAARWTVTPDLAERRIALARTLLDRYGIVTREVAHAEDVAGGFASVYEVLKLLEEQGRVRRGYFVKGRGGAQFALPGADERLRMPRPADDEAAIVLAATDPANAWGAVLEWPAPTGAASEIGAATAPRPQRAAASLVVLRGGALLAWLGRAEPALVTFLPPDEPGRSAAARALAAALAGRVDGARRKALVIASIDGVDARRSPLADFFTAAGFTPTMHGLLRRAPAAAGDGEDPSRAPHGA